MQGARFEVERGVGEETTDGQDKGPRGAAYFGRFLSMGYEAFSRGAENR
jgi:hypothetical protein